MGAGGFFFFTCFLFAFAEEVSGCWNREAGDVISSVWLETIPVVLGACIPGVVPQTSLVFHGGHFARSWLDRPEGSIRLSWPSDQEVTSAVGPSPRVLSQTPFQSTPGTGFPSCAPCQRPSLGLVWAGHSCHVHRIPEWFGLEWNVKIIQSQPLLWTGTPPTRAGCSGPHPRRPRTLPGVNYPWADVPQPLSWGCVIFLQCQTQVAFGSGAVLNKHSLLFIIPFSMSGGRSR